MKNNSRFLSLVLRHKPEIIGIELDKNGWVNIDELLEQMNGHDKIIDYEELMDIVENNDKKRFEIKNDFIRATQGHSKKVDLALKAVRPPNKLYHGTVDKFIGKIKEKGLLKMNRHAVHLSEDISTATNVGSRRGKPTILEVNSAKMYVENIKFFKTSNGVWLTDKVLPKYINFNKND